MSKNQEKKTCDEDKVDGIPAFVLYFLEFLFEFFFGIPNVTFAFMKNG